MAGILQRDLGWPMLWCHLFDPVYTAVGEYKCPALTDGLMREAARHLMDRGRDFLAVRPSRQAGGLRAVRADAAEYGYRFVPVKLTAAYPVLVTRVTRRWAESPYRLTTKAALDEYLAARPAEDVPGEFEVPTDSLTPEQVAGKIKELLP